MYNVKHPKDSIGLVIFEILSFRPKILTTLYNRKCNFCKSGKKYPPPPPIFISKMKIGGILMNSSGRCNTYPLKGTISVGKDTQNIQEKIQGLIDCYLNDFFFSIMINFKC